jgi:hypothetical protein
MSQPPKIKSQPFEAPFVRVRGRLSREGKVRWSPCLRTFHRPRRHEESSDTEQAPKAEPAARKKSMPDRGRIAEPKRTHGERPQFFILFLDKNGEVLERAPVRIRFFAREKQNALFTQRLPYHPETRRVALVAKDQLLGALDVTEHEPEFALVRPLSHQEVDSEGVLHLRWEEPKASGDKGPITYFVRYSANGEKWVRPGVNLADPAFDLDLRSLPGGDRCVAQIIGTNGYRTAYVETPPFPVPRKDPEIIMSSPGGPLLFAQGYSHEEGPLLGKSIEWLADGQVLGTGASFDARQSRRGRHHLAVRVSDSIGRFTTQHLGWYDGLTGHLVPRKPGF